MRKLFAVLFVLFAFTTSLFAGQKDDPRISQAARLARINMDPVNMEYRTNYDTHVVGVLLRPSEGKLESKTKWHNNLAVPSGTMIDIPKDANFAPFTFAAPNGETVDAIRVTLAPNTEAKVNACGNGHIPAVSMIVKMIEPLVETRVVTREAPKAPIITNDGLNRAARILETKDVDFRVPRWHDPCTLTTLRKVTCTALAIGIGAGTAYALSDNNEPSGCNYCNY